MATTVEQRRFMTVAEVAEELGLSRVRCYDLVAEGYIPSIRLSPRRIRIPRDAFEAWLAERATPSTSEGAPAGALATSADAGDGHGSG